MTIAGHWNEVATFGWNDTKIGD